MRNKDLSPRRLMVTATDNGFTVTMADGSERNFANYGDADYAAEHNGELPQPFDYSGFTAAQRRAAYLRATSPGDRPRNPLTGHFTGGDRGDR